MKSLALEQPYGVQPGRAGTVIVAGYSETRKTVTPELVIASTADHASAPSGRSCAGKR